MADKSGEARRSVPVRVLGRVARSARMLAGIQPSEVRKKQRLFERDFAVFSRLASDMQDDRFAIRKTDVLAKMDERTASTPFDAHYVFHTAWAARHLAVTRPAVHHDFASDIRFATLVSAFIPMVFHDYRPLLANLEGLECRHADLTKLTLAGASLGSVSCMHVLEHIGLGRYGDEIDPQGDAKAMRELRRILAPGGDLFLVVPVGEPRIQFNAHRIYSYEMVQSAFSDFRLQDFSLIRDDGLFLQGAEPGLVKSQRYGCGCFWFKKAESK